LGRFAGPEESGEHPAIIASTPHSGAALRIVLIVIGLMIDFSGSNEGAIVLHARAEVRSISASEY
jgi:hypothetical protein